MFQYKIFIFKLFPKYWFPYKKIFTFHCYYLKPSINFLIVQRFNSCLSIKYFYLKKSSPWDRWNMVGNLVTRSFIYQNFRSFTTSNLVMLCLHFTQSNMVLSFFRKMCNISRANNLFYGMVMKSILLKIKLNWNKKACKILNSGKLKFYFTDQNCQICAIFTKFNWNFSL